jgi:Carboxypeptidase regulatory-like domain/TonB dependent receptor
MHTRLFSRTISVLILSIFCFITYTSAQSDQGRISGRVVDPAKAIVPGATVVLTNAGTNEVRTVVANNEGVYSIPALRAANYTLTVSGASFAKKTITGIELAVGQQLELELALSPEEQTVTVDVVGGTEGVDANTASIGATVNARETRDLPLNGRQLSQLYLQAPGTVNSGSGTFGDIRFSGRAVQQNVIRYDGVEGSAIIDASPGNLNGEVPSKFRLQSSLENVQEFKVDSNNFPAEYGTGTGGQISVVTKSGTNAFHGSLFEYLRNDAFDARNYFDNIQSGIPKSTLKLNQFGGSLGGPIIKDKLFFFGSYEGYRVRTGLNFVEAAPSLTLAQPGAFIPGTATLVNPAIQPFIAAFRSPNAVSLGPAVTPGFDVVQLQDTAKVTEDAFSARLDYQADEANNFYLRFFRDNGTDLSPEGVSGRTVKIEAEPQNGVVGWQSIINQNLLNDFRMGYNGARTRINGQAPTVGGIDFSSIILNISGSVAISGIAGQGSSSGVSVPGGLVRANSATNGRGQPYTPYSLSLVDSVSWTKGNHNIKFGGELRFIRLYTDRLGGTTYTFANLAGFLGNTPQSVQYLGDLSAPSLFNNGITGERLAKQEYYIGYGQDQWKIRPGLTLSYGMRYEYYAPLREDRNGQILFDIVSGQLHDPSEPAFQSSKSNFGPRVALTWSPDQDGSGFFSGGKTVVRGGIGIYYGPGQTEDQIQPIESDRVSTTITSGSLLAFPANIPAIVTNFANNPLNRTYQPRAYSREYKIPERIVQYSVSWQQELPYNMVATIAYVGSQGSNLFLRSVANKILPGQTTITDGTALPAGVGVINRVNGAGRVIGVNTVREFDLLSGTTQNRPFAEIDYKTVGGDDRYDALQTSLSRRFSTGLTMNAQYTYGFSRGNTAGSNEARTGANLDDFEADRGRNNFDVRHTFNISALYELPVGKGKHFDLQNSVANYILGDWELGGIVNARSGLPVEVGIVRPDVVIVCTNAAAGCTAGQVLPLPGTINAANPLPAGFTAVVNTPGGGASRNVRRPDVVPGQSFYIDNDRFILNPAAFTTPAPGTFGNLPRNALRGPIFRQVDLVLNKRFRFTETVNLQFRTEVFNIFNTTNFASPASSLATVLTPAFQPGTPYTQSLAGATFGQLRQTVERSVGLGTNRQIQFALRLTF